MIKIIVIVGIRYTININVKFMFYVKYLTQLLRKINVINVLIFLSVVRQY